MKENDERYHFIGIGGIGMSALARILLDDEKEVSGSDLSSSSLLEGLEKKGAKVSLGHHSENIKEDMIVVYSTAVKKDNPEYQAALKEGCVLMHRSDLLKKIMIGQKTLAVAGTHGKTTTSSLLSAVLLNANKDPSYAIGGSLRDTNCNGYRGRGEYFIAEADESDGTFVKYSSFAAIATNLEEEHLDYYQSKENLVSAFQTFISQVFSEKFLFLCGDDPNLMKMSENRGVSYGFGENCSLRAVNFRQKGWYSYFDAIFENKVYKDIVLSLVGKYNALNALAVLGMALRLGIPEEVIRCTFQNFKGVARRCQIVSEIRKLHIIDDYAHHPTEVKSVLRAIRDASEERRLVVVFQPHRYTRTRDCMDDFSHAFDLADFLILTDIYSSGEDPIPGVYSEVLLKKISERSSLPCSYMPKRNLADELQNFLRPHDVLVTMGAGDISALSRDLSRLFMRQPPKKITLGLVQGGRSGEHEISLKSAKNILNILDKDLYEVKSFSINKKGLWRNSENFSFDEIGGEFWKEIQACEVFIPALDGPYGEGGAVQGFFEILDRPYIGCDHSSASICMDKAFTKRLAISEGIASAAFMDFSKRDWRTSPDEVARSIESALRFPLFVKPSHLGSSLGAYKAEDVSRLFEALEESFRVDTHVLVEEELVGRELKFAVLGNSNLSVFGPGELDKEKRFYDYKSKYDSDPMKTEITSKLSSELVEKGCRLAKETYRLFRCMGLAQVDFFLDGEGKYWLSEINPFPGFMERSVYPKLLEREGISGKELMDTLIVLGLAKYREKKRVFQ